MRARQSSWYCQAAAAGRGVDGRARNGQRPHGRGEVDPSLREDMNTMPPLPESGGRLVAVLRFLGMVLGCLCATQGDNSHHHNVAIIASITISIITITIICILLIIITAIIILLLLY